MRTGKVKARFLLIGIVVALTAYLASGWDDLQRGFNDAQAGKPYSYHETK